MIEADTADPQHRIITRAHSTLVTKRKSVWIYKGRLCIRSDTAPIAQTAFVSTPTSNRCGILRIFFIASQASWPTQSADVSQDSPQAGNSDPNGRAILIPPQTAQLPWGKSLRPPEKDLETCKSPPRRFVLIPLYMGVAALQCVGF